MKKIHLIQLPLNCFTLIGCFEMKRFKKHFWKKILFLYFECDILSTDKIRKLVFEKVLFSFVSSTFKYKMETSCNQWRTCCRSKWNSNRSPRYGNRLSKRVLFHQRWFLYQQNLALWVSVWNKDSEYGMDE